MKKILCLVIAIMLMLTCVGCSNSKDNKVITDGRFSRVEDGYFEGGIPASIVVDIETKVMYLVTGGSLTVMLDADGKPLLWEG